MKKVLNRAGIRFEHFYNQPNKQISHLIVGPSYLFVRPLQYKYIIYQNEKPFAPADLSSNSWNRVASARGQMEKKSNKCILPKNET